MLLDVIDVLDVMDFVILEWLEFYGMIKMLWNVMNLWLKREAPPTELFRSVLW